ncbi:MAG: C40 family peptidase, partial [Candidatus Moduliflexus flocculans]|nr:C40 family peptidase [Candidatus Moduliflexus flocculans]
MHRGPSAETDVVSQALLGDNVKVLKSEKDPAGEDWHRIVTPDTYEGWVPASSLRFLGRDAKPYAAAGKVFVVSSLLANTYREPDVTKHRPVKVAPIGTVLEVVGEKGERWLEVNLPCDTRAWVQKGDGDVREMPWSWPRRPVEDMIALSKRFIGLPYTWGGTSPLGLDCSGFAQLVYRMSGIPILRDADIQMTDERPRRGPQGPGETRRPRLLRPRPRPHQPRRDHDRGRELHQRDDRADADASRSTGSPKSAGRRSTRVRAAEVKRGHVRSVHVPGESVT